jgi:hypothetical protein
VPKEQRRQQGENCLVASEPLIFLRFNTRRPRTTKSPTLVRKATALTEVIHWQIKGI